MADDSFFNDANEFDIVIPVMGPTGVGKSTFINWIAGEAKAKVGQTLESTTETLQPIIINVKKMGLDRPFLKGKRLILLDTPGFDDTSGHEAVILRRIAVWLARSYKCDHHSLGGIVHLHDITQTKVFPSTRRSFEVFSCLCGDSAYPRIALGTMKWPLPVSPADSQDLVESVHGGSPRRQAERRFFQLQDAKYWGRLIDLGSEPYQVENVKSALDLVDSILQKLEELELTKGDERLELQIQQEIVVQGKSISRTKAGQVLKGHEKSRRDAMTQEEKEAEKVIRRELMVMDRQLASMANRQTFSTWKRLAARMLPFASDWDYP